MLNSNAYLPLSASTLQKWWTKHSQTSMPLAIKYVAQSNSTNAQLYSSVNLHNTLLVAEQQMHGKGQFERAWVSQSGDLTFSIGLVLNAHQLSALSLRVGLALHQAFYQQGLEVKLKWVNDIIAFHPNTQQGGKLAGILIQTRALEKDLIWVIIGVGINVGPRLLPNHTSAFSPIGLAQLSEVWAAPETGAREALLMNLVDTILVHIETADVQHNLNAQWNAHDIWLNTPVTLTDPQGIEHHGVAAGVNQQGEYQLIINHTLHSFYSGQLRTQP